MAAGAMKPQAWAWVALGSAGVLLLMSRRRDPSGGSVILGSPVEMREVPTVTPHGYFGAPRAGPPKHAHQGIDLAAPAGSHVLAVGDGVIVRTAPGLGKIVRKLRLDVPTAWDFSHRRVDAIVYADLGTPLVQPGDRVRKGDPIALVDKAGFVHFAVKEARPSGEVFFDPKQAGFTYRLAHPLVS
jgi:murein DD-endopeptidase MepM/ murein hydrolase activator NlpD